MPNFLDVNNIWKIMREVDLGPIRAEAERMTWIAVVGEDEKARANLIQALCHEARKALPVGDASQVGPDPLSLDLDRAPREMSADLIVLLVDLSANTAKAWGLFQDWHAAGKKIVILFGGQGNPNGFGGAWEGARGLRGSVTDQNFLENEFASAVLELLPERELSLARYYPVFRMRVAQQLISSTSMANANYALTTGLAEIIPILDIPFNVADIVILTKNQAIMAYKLGLALGLSGRWQDHMAAFGSTLGTSFIWRQVARELIGLIPIWGLIPKVAVSYAGTYVLGEGIMQWYITGRDATPALMRQLYREAIDRGKNMARAMLERAPRHAPKLALPSPPRLRLPSPQRPHLASRAHTICPNCGASNPPQNKYCGKCGAALESKS